MIKRMLTQYECEVCGKRSFNRNEIQACEIKHYNTTYDWLVKNFDAVCECPIAVQKTQPGDDWDSHIYELDCNKVLRFAGVL